MLSISPVLTTAKCRYGRRRRSHIFEPSPRRAQEHAATAHHSAAHRAAGRYHLDGRADGLYRATRDWHAGENERRAAIFCHFINSIAAELYFIF